SVPGVRTVNGSGLTGSVWIEYDPFRLAESTLVDVLRQLDTRLDTGGREAPLTMEVPAAAHLDASSPPRSRLGGATTTLALPVSELVSWPVLAGVGLRGDCPA